MTQIMAIYLWKKSNIIYYAHNLYKNKFWMSKDITGQNSLET